MSPQSSKKNKNVWKKNPIGVGCPRESATLKKYPNVRWVTRYVSGFATTKNINDEYNAYFAFSATFGI